MRGLAEGQLDGAHPALTGSGSQFGRLIKVLVHLRVENAGRGPTTAHGSTAYAQCI